jgi:hypothetical protein
VLAHRYLDNVLLRWSEGSVAGWFRERPERAEQMRALIEEYLAGFADGYSPEGFVRELPSFRGIDIRLRAELLAAVRAEYRARFHPDERCGEVRARADQFIAAFDDWSATFSNEPGSESAEAWKLVRERAGALHRLLVDPELRCRWIP